MDKRSIPRTTPHRPPTPQPLQRPIPIQPVTGGGPAAPPPRPLAPGLQARPGTWRHLTQDLRTGTVRIELPGQRLDPEVQAVARAMEDRLNRRAPSPSSRAGLAEQHGACTAADALLTLITEWRLPMPTALALIDDTGVWQALDGIPPDAFECHLRTPPAGEPAPVLKAGHHHHPHAIAAVIAALVLADDADSAARLFQACTSARARSAVVQLLLDDPRAPLARLPPSATAPFKTVIENIRRRRRRLQANPFAQTRKAGLREDALWSGETRARLIELNGALEAAGWTLQDPGEGLRLVRQTSLSPGAPPPLALLAEIAECLLVQPGATHPYLGAITDALAQLRQTLPGDAHTHPDPAVCATLARIAQAPAAMFRDALDRLDALSAGQAMQTLQALAELGGPPVDGLVQSLLDALFERIASILSDTPSRLEPAVALLAAVASCAPHPESPLAREIEQRRAALHALGMDLVDTTDARTQVIGLIDLAETTQDARLMGQALARAGQLGLADVLYLRVSPELIDLYLFLRDAARDLHSPAAALRFLDGITACWSPPGGTLPPDVAEQLVRLLCINLPTIFCALIGPAETPRQAQAVNRLAHWIWLNGTVLMEQTEPTPATMLPYWIQRFGAYPEFRLPLHQWQLLVGSDMGAPLTPDPPALRAALRQQLQRANITVQQALLRCDCGPQGLNLYEDGCLRVSDWIVPASIESMGLLGALLEHTRRRTIVHDLALMHHLTDMAEFESHQVLIEVLIQGPALAAHQAVELLEAWLDSLKPPSSRPLWGESAQRLIGWLTRNIPQEALDRALLFRLANPLEANLARDLAVAHALLPHVGLQAAFKAIGQLCARSLPSHVLVRLGNGLQLGHSVDAVRQPIRTLKARPDIRSADLAMVFLGWLDAQLGKATREPLSDAEYAVMDTVRDEVRQANIAALWARVTEHRPGNH